jgi:hypothetical protein
MWRHSLATPTRLRTAPWSLHGNRADAARNEGASSHRDCFVADASSVLELLPTLNTVLALRVDAAPDQRASYPGVSRPFCRTVGKPDLQET